MSRRIVFPLNLTLSSCTVSRAADGYPSVFFAFYSEVAKQSLTTHAMRSLNRASCLYQGYQGTQAPLFLRVTPILVLCFFLAFLFKCCHRISSTLPILRSQEASVNRPSPPPQVVGVPVRIVSARSVSRTHRIEMH